MKSNQLIDFTIPSDFLLLFFFIIDKTQIESYGDALLMRKIHFVSHTKELHLKNYQLSSIPFSLSSIQYIEVN